MTHISTMYDTPEVIVQMPAIDSIQAIGGKPLPPIVESEFFREPVAAYQDYEE